MIKDTFRYIFLFFGLILIQVLLFNNVQLGGYVNPYIYVLFILLLPFETPGYLLLILGFLLGLSIDVFSDTPGIHASATVFVAAIRPMILSLISSREVYEKGTLPRIRFYGFAWFLKYALVLIFIHHFVLFFVEAFTFIGFHHTLLRIVASVGVSLGVIVLSQFVVFKD